MLSNFICCFCYCLFYIVYKMVWGVGQAVGLGKHPSKGKINGTKGPPPEWFVSQIWRAFQVKFIQFKITLCYYYVPINYWMDQKQHFSTQSHLQVGESNQALKILNSVIQQTICWQPPSGFYCPVVGNPNRFLPAVYQAYCQCWVQ